VRRAAWDFAVELRVLERAGVDVTDLECLVAMRYAEHGRDETTDASKRRRFRRPRHLTFGERTCFILTDRGEEQASPLFST
jgi:hypothetical protein